MDELIKISDLNFKYPKSDFELTIPKLSLLSGQIVLITGSNGCGKTTLSKLCLGLLKDYAGTIELKGKNLKDYSLGQIGQVISYLFQEPSQQLFTPTVWEEMTFIGLLKDEDPQVLQTKAVKLLKQFNLSKLARRSIYNLSRGEKQRLAIASLLMNDIEYLFLDEPSTGLDAENRKILYDVIKDLKENGIGIAIITHDHEVINEFPEHIYRLEVGEKFER